MDKPKLIVCTQRKVKLLQRLRVRRKWIDMETQRMEGPIIIRRTKRTVAPFAVLPFPKYDRFFQCQSIDDRGNLLVRCLMCCQKTKLLSCSASSSSNLRKHVKSQHPERLQEIDSSSSVDVRKRCRRENGNGTTSSPMRPSSSVPQTTIDQLVANYIIQDLHPTSLCDRTSFRELVSGLQPQRTVMSSDAFVARMEREYEAIKTRLVQVLSQVATVSTTADCWSSAKGSTLGMTVHWINPLTLDRCSAALGCRRLKGTPSYDVIAEAMDETFRDFKIQDKVCSTTTDNGTNFCKAFGLFGDEDGDDDDSEGSDVELISIEEVLAEGSQSGRFYSLPPHIRCASHTLGLVATKDVQEALKDETFKWICESTFAKCNSLWNMQALSTCVADNIKDTLGIHLICPNVTRWNSMYDAMKQICDLCQIPDKMDSCCAILGLSPFQRNELTFIREYCEIMHPMTTALNILQSEKKMFIGYLLPTIHTLEKNLQQRTMRPMNFCLPLLNAVKNGVRNRFDSIWWDQKLVVASCLLPKFKFDWLHDDEVTRSEVKKWLLAEIGASLSLNASTVSAEDDDASFFHFTKTESCSENNSAEMQLQTYIQTHRKDICMFLESPLLKSLFIKYNTSLTSSASVERLFSLVGDIFSKKRFRLASVSDPHFEKKFLLKFNGPHFK